MNRSDFIHETAIRVLAALYVNHALTRTSTQLAEVARDAAQKLAEAFDIDHPEGADVLDDEPWRPR